MAPNEDWLSRTVEEPLETQIPILDPHHHLWERPENRYLTPELVADTKTHDVRQTVFIECSSMYRPSGPVELMPVGETEFVNGAAAMSASGAFGPLRGNAGIVGTADLRLGAKVDSVLEAHIAAAPGRFRGIRHRAAWPAAEPITGQPAIMEHLLMDSEFRRGFASLRRYGLTFEAWLFHPDIPDAADLAGAFPDTTIILNHLGGPIVSGEYGSRSEVFDRWKKDITDLAVHENVVVKLGGIQMVVNGFGWHERDKPPTSDELLEVNREWYLHAIEQFGPERCMFESNFPVDRLSCSYAVLWNQFKKLSSDFRPDERLAMFHDTAARVYRLPFASELPNGE